MLPVKSHLLFVLALGVAAAPIAAQQDAPPSDDSQGFFFETVDVNLVNVDVYVTDKKGQPITGLTVADFEILEDGRPVKISNFYSQERGSEVQPQTEVDAGSAVDTGRQLPLIPDDQRLYLVVYVDNFNIRPLNRNRVFRRLREFLHDRLSPDDQVMLVSYDRSVHVRHPFTSDADLIARALFDLEEMTGHAMMQDSERSEILEAIDTASDANRVMWRVRQFAQSLANDLSFSIDHLKEFVDSLGGIKGRKAIVHVSDGMQIVPGEDLFQAISQKFNTTEAYSYMQDTAAHRKFQELIATANSNRVSFYTVDAAGLRGSTVSTASSRGTTTPGLTTLIDSTYTNNVQAPLRLMANGTGGQAILNTNDIGPGLAKAANDFETYYSLGYIASHAGDGRYHRLEVNVKNRKGLRVRHRDGYRDKSLFDRMSDGTRAALLYGFERNPLAAELHIGRGAAQEPDRYLVPVAVHVPIGKVQLVPQAEVHVGRIKLYLSALDDAGRSSDLQEVPLDIRIPADDLERALQLDYEYRVELKMRGGPQRIALGVRDEIGGVSSFVTANAVVGGGT